MLYARIIQSTIPHGIVKSIDAKDALSNPDIKALLTCKNDSSIWNAGERTHERRIFTEHVRFVGDAIGAVAATSRSSAQEAVDKIKVEYEELPAVFSIDDALDHPSKIWGDGDLIGPLEYGFGDAPAVFNSNGIFTVLEADYSTSRVHNSPLEPAASLAWWEGDKLTVVAATQGIFGCREGLSRDLNMAAENIRVISLYKGGGFGNKNSSMNYDVIAALLSRLSGKPVMVEYSREEEFVGVHGRWSSRQHLKGAISRDGSLLAVDMKAHCDVGAYTRHIKAGRFVEGPENYYSCEAWHGEVLGVYTNTPATAHMRAPTGPQSCFASESFLDEVAFRLGMNPVEIRLKNALTKYQNSKSLTSNHLKDCLVLGADRFGWNRRWKPESEKTTENGELLGVGVALATWHSRLGIGEAIVALKSNGTAKVTIGVVDIGTGAKSTMALIAANELGIPVDSVSVVWGDTSFCPFSIGESGSRTTSFTGAAVREAASKVKRKLVSLASGKTEAPEQSDVERRTFNKNSGTNYFDISHLMKSAGLDEISEKAVTELTLPENQERLSFAAHFAEVRVDIETGEVKVTDYLAVHESGEIVNPLTARSQVRGGVVMGIGMALYERLIIDPSYGSIMNSNFYSYHLPNIVSIPRIAVEFLSSDDPLGPKSLGEIPIVPVPAAIGNAIFNATGVRLRDLPFSREKLSNELMVLKKRE